MTYQIDKKRSIGQAAKEIEVQEHVIRFWETQFDEIQPTIGSGNRRYFYDKDIRILKTIKHYLYEKGFTIKGLQKILKSGEVSIDINDTNSLNSKITSTNAANINNFNNIEKSMENRNSTNYFIDSRGAGVGSIGNDFSGMVSKKNNSKLKDSLKSLKNKLNIFYEKLKSI